MTARLVTPEILDGLPYDNPSAMRSRRDLRRVHRVMGTRSILVRALRSSTLVQRKLASVRILEIGAGDGHLMLEVARNFHNVWRHVDMTLLDQSALVQASTIAQYASLGWNITTAVGDVLAWAAPASETRPEMSANERWDLIIANLFLHHFEGPQLAAIMAAIEARTDCFVACEPRRSTMARVGSHMIGALAVNAVTRADAVSSVHAGFCDVELSTLWPGNSARWILKESPAGLFSHRFVAERSN